MIDNIRRAAHIYATKHGIDLLKLDLDDKIRRTVSECPLYDSPAGTYMWILNEVIRKIDYYHATEYVL